MRALIFVPDRNSPGKSDATGAFHPEAIKLALLHGVDPEAVVRVNTSVGQGERRKQVLEALRSSEPADVVAFFCHGWRTGIQFGFQLQHAAELAAAIVRGNASKDLPLADAMLEPRVALYCCSTGAGKHGGEGGFADRLRDEMCKLGAVNCRVDAHDRKGHTTQNPYVLRYEGLGSPRGATGGTWIVSPNAAREFRVWNIALKKTDLRLRFPLMSTAEIHAELFA